LIKLILGYYQINAGVLKIAGNDMDRLNLEWWRRQCGVVMQDGVIFSESIERNIAVSDGEIDRNRVEEAAMVANIKEYINSLPLKYDTKIGPDGVGLSQGQKQRILIARAVYKNPPFILLDEATNALDAKNERVIVENLARFYKGRTVVVVAHRLSTVRDADKIIVLDGGRVAETGSHESLIRKQGAYYTLVKNQLELGT
jgi:ATP-binding cassette subfamily B protein